MQNQIASDAKTTGRKENKKPNRLSIRNGGALNQITSDAGMFQMHSKAAIKRQMMKFD